MRLKAASGTAPTHGRLPLIPTATRRHPPPAPPTEAADPKQGLPGLVLVFGALTLTAQVILLREILVLSQGQELKLGLALWCWLLGTGLGSLAGGGWFHGRTVDQGTLRGALVLLALLFLAALLTLRALPTLGWVKPGQALGPGQAALLFLTVLAPFGVVSGGFFPLACQALKSRGAAGAGGRVYALEALGAALGVAVLQVLLWGRLPALALGLGAALLTMAAALLLAPPAARLGRLAGGAAAALLGALLLCPQLDHLTRSWQFPGRRLLAAVDSPSALLTAFQETEQVSFAASGVWHFTWPDPMVAEQAAQVALLSHPQPRQVLLLGGGVAGLAAEVLRTPSVRRVDYVEADPELVPLAFRLLPPAATEALRDPRVRVVHGDARRFLEGSSQDYDVILMALPEPHTAQLNRFYSLEFFTVVARRLAPGGVFSFALPGSPTALSPLRAGYLGSLAATLNQAFPAVVALPGEQVRFLASPTPGALSDDPQILADRLGSRNLALHYLDPYTLETEFSRDRQEVLARALAQAHPEINLDLVPIPFFYETALAASREGIRLDRVLLALKRLPPWVPVLAWLLLGMAGLVLVRRRPHALPVLQVTLVGAGTLALEVISLITFQIFLGHLYRHLGVLIAAFMVGMAGGGLWGNRHSPRPHLFAALQGGQTFLLLTALLGLAMLPSHRPPEVLVAAATFLLLVAGGFLGGGVFALSAAAWSSRGAEARKEGALYAADLLGATLGAASISLLALPVYGVRLSLAGVAALHGMAALLAWAPPRR